MIEKDFGTGQDMREDCSTGTEINRGTAARLLDEFLDFRKSTCKATDEFAKFYGQRALPAVAEFVNDTCNAAGKSPFGQLLNSIGLDLTDPNAQRELGLSFVQMAKDFMGTEFYDEVRKDPFVIQQEKLYGKDGALLAAVIVASMRKFFQDPAMALVSFCDPKFWQNTFGKYADLFQKAWESGDQGARMKLFLATCGILQAASSGKGNASQKTQDILLDLAQYIEKKQKTQTC